MPNLNNTGLPVVGGVIRDRRRRMGLSINDLASAAGISRYYLSNIEAGRRTQVSAHIAKAFAERLSIRLGVVTGELDEERGAA